MKLEFEGATNAEKILLKQLNYALVLTYTKAGQAGQKAVKAGLPQRFVLRNNFVTNSFRLEAATKKNPWATIFVPTDGPYNADFLIRQQEGGIKTPKGRHIAIPASSIGVHHAPSQHKIRRGKNAGQVRESVVRNSRGLIKRGFKPKELLQDKKQYFIGTIKSKLTGKATYGIWKRTGKHTSRGGYPAPFVNLMYILVPQGIVQERLEFHQTAIKAAKEALPKAFEDALIEAVRTTR